MEEDKRRGDAGVREAMEEETYLKELNANFISTKEEGVLLMVSGFHSHASAFHPFSNASRREEL